MNELEQRQYQNDSIQSKIILVFELPLFFYFSITTKVLKKFGNFKIRFFFDWMESFLYCLSSSFWKGFLRTRTFHSALAIIFWLHTIFLFWLVYKDIFLILETDLVIQCFLGNRCILNLMQRISNFDNLIKSPFVCSSNLKIHLAIGQRRHCCFFAAYLAPC